MQDDLLLDAQRYAKKKYRHRIWRRIVSVLGCAVVFCTTYALILPAITKENDTFCGIEAHTHDDSCYGEAALQLTCSPVHVHTAECTDAEGNNLCGKADFVVHTHDASCLDESGNLVCTLLEIEEHTHDTNCYETVAAGTHVHGDGCYSSKKGELVCTTEESEGHTHNDECYSAGSNLTCQKEETQGHSHGESCYETARNLICQTAEDENHTHDENCYETVTNLTCQLPEEEAHAHSDACYEKVLICGLPEDPGHQHSDDCYAWNEVLVCQIEENAETTERTLVCTKQEVKLHTHSDACYSEEKLICGQLEVLEHVHNDECFATGGQGTLICQLEEHTHELMCYSNPDADLETAADWEQTFSQVELTGVWENDVLAIAKTQLGYHESTKNYMVWEDDSTHGYTRYGEWFGVPYGDWCAMFASFCLHYAGVENMPLNNSCDPWIAALSAEDCGLYRTAAEHTPQPGELIFFDWDVNGNSEHVGIVAELIPATEEEPAKIKTIEGNSSNQVQYVTYNADDAVILGYAVLPYQLSESEQADVDYVIGLIDALPSADEIDAKLAEFEDAEDYEGEEAWLTEVYQQVAEAYTYYNLLSTVQKQRVTNADKLMGLEYIWSVVTYSTTTDRPTIYQINSYDRSDGTFDGDSDAAVMVHGDGTKTVQEILGVADSWQFYSWYAVIVTPVTENNTSYLKVTSVIGPSSNKLNYTPPVNGYILLFYKDEVIPDAVVGDYVTIHFTVPASGAEKSEGYGTVSFSESPSGIISDTPTKISSASTSDFVELNLFDYNGNINTNYWATNNWYPGFQWNGGAYSNDSGDGDSNDYRYYYSQTGIGIPNAITDRNVIDSIDFGNSLITNLIYGYGSNGSYTKAINATAVGFLDKTATHPINWLYGNSTEGYTNKPIGYSTTDLTENQNVMKYTLVEGYPALTDGTMLDYLFKDDTDKGSASAVTQLNTESIDGLFLYDEKSGAYSFNSRENHAEYVSGENRFQLYDEIITPNFITYPFGNFLPLNTIDDSSKATQVGAFNYSGGMRNYVEKTIADLKNDAEGLGSYWSSSQTQLATMLEEYQENWTLYPRTINSVSNKWENLSAANAIRDYFWGDTDGGGDNPSDSTGFITQEYLDSMYNIDWDVQTNFFFGMEMKMNFYQPKDGMTGTDTDGDGDFDYPMEFNFTGDDDVWVYIDDVLFLDLSGIHRHVGGQIDFVDGVVNYYALDTSTGDVSSTPYLTYTFEEILKAAGASTNGLNDKGTFENYTTHSFNFYYMERGSGSSVCRLNFNFPLLRQNTLSVEKELADDDSTAAVEALGNPDFLFQVLDADNDSLFLPDGWAYSLYDVDGSVIQEIEVTEKYQDGRVKTMVIKDGSGNTLCKEEYDSNGNMTSRTGDGQDKVKRIGDNGIFALKAGQKAEFVGIPETWGKYYVRELLEGTVAEQYGTITVSGTAVTPQDMTVGGVSYSGVKSPVLDMTNGSSSFRIENKITTSKLGSLSITKELDASYSGNTDKTFKFSVTLDGEPLPEGTTYTVGSETKTVTVDKDTAGKVTASYVEITVGQTATINHILAGTAFEVTETTDSAKGYTVTYSVDGTDQAADSAKGTVGVETTASVSVTNSEIGTSVEIPMAKTMSYFGNASRTYQFTIEQVADQNGTALDLAGYSDTVTLYEPKSGYTKHIFKINYTLNDVPTNKTKTYYYKVSEVQGTAAVRYDTKYYIVKVDVANSNDVLSAQITDIWKVDGDTTVQISGTEMTDTTILFTNTILRNLIVSKTVSGTSDTSSEFDFTLELVKHESNADLPTELIGIKTTADGEQEVSYPLTNGVVTFKLKHGESVKFMNIPYRSQWTLTETAVDGFATTYTITANNVTEEYAGNEVKNQLASAANTTVAFTNAQTYELPETGGAGTTSYTMAGLMLMLCSVAYLLYRYKKRRREAR